MHLDYISRFSVLDGKILLFGLFHSGSPQSPGMSTTLSPSINVHGTRTTKTLIAAHVITRMLLTALVKTLAFGSS